MHQWRHDYDILRDRNAIRSVLGYLPQDFRFFEKLKTWEFLDYGAGLAGIKGTRKRSEIVDEPTTGLDPEERIRFRNILSEVSDKDVIIILSTHIVGDISSTCKKLALLNKGELKFEGSPDDMIELVRGKVWEIFVTDPELQQIKEKYPIISTMPSEGGWEIQIVTEKLEGFDGKAIIPNIEHAYVYFMDYLLKDKMEMYSEKIGGDLFN